MIRMPHLTWRQRAALVVAGLVFTAAGGMELAGAPAAFATDGSLSYSQDCTAGYVTVVSHWDGGAIHVLVDNPAGGATFDVPPLGTKTVRLGFNGASSFLTRTSSSNGHLNGQPPGTVFEHRFTQTGDCTPPSTTAPSPTTTTCTQAIPPRDDCGTPPPSTTIPPTPTTLPMVESSVVQSPDTTAPAVPSTGEATRGGAPAAPAGPSTTVCVPTGGQLTPGARPCTLPTTGGGDVLLLVGAIAGFLILVGLILETAKRADRWKKDQERGEQ